MRHFYKHDHPAFYIVLYLFKIQHVLEERQAALLCGLEIALDQLTDNLSFSNTELQGLIIGQTTTHVPGHLHGLLSD